MTEDYKKNLIDYLTGKLNNESGTQKDFDIKNTRYFSYDGDVWNDIKTQLLNIGTIHINGVLQNDNYDVSIVYGSLETSAEDRGFLIYLDKNLLPIKLLLKYNTGNNLRGFQKLYYDKEENRCYGVIGDYLNLGAYDTRFAFFDNLFYKGTDYEVNIRTSYDISDNSFFCVDIVKDPAGSNYLMIGADGNTKRNARAIELKIIVGSSNEWKRWNSSSIVANLLITGWYALYSNNQPTFKIMEYNASTYKLGVLYNTGDTLNLTEYLDVRTDNVTQPFFVIRPVESQFINENEIYFSVPMRWQMTSGGTTIRGGLSILYKYNGSGISEVYRTEVATATQSGDTTVYERMYQLNILKDTDNTLYLLRYYSNNYDSTTSVYLLNLTNHMNNIQENDWEYILSGNYLQYVRALNQMTFFIRKYNLIEFCSLTAYQQNDTSIGFEVAIKCFSPINGYNGNSYTGVNSLVPQLSNLYSNSSLVFSRNLYNVSKQNNTTTSSVEIPYNFLNDITIDKNDLLSKTNLIMNDDTSSWTKNIYESVDLNFINTISIIDEDTGEQYTNGATKLNYGTTGGGNTNYQNTICNKYRINYADGTNLINTINWININDLVKQTTLTISAYKEIKNIDLISNDESSIYLTINGNFEIGKNYTINQKVRIGNKPELQNLLYNSQDILYSSEQVKVYTY